MKKSKATALIAASFAMAMGLSACGGSGDGKNSDKDLSKLTAPFRSANETQTVYGPPPDYDPTADDPAEMYGPPVDHPDVTETEVVGIYGPGLDYGDEDEG